MSTLPMLKKSDLASIRVLGADHIKKWFLEDEIDHDTSSRKETGFIAKIWKFYGAVSMVFI